MRAKKTDVLEQRIELFCKSSQELLTGINNKQDTGSKKKRKKKKEAIKVQDRHDDYVDKDHYDDFF